MLIIISLFASISPLNLADSLYLSKNYYDAATEYERFLYHFPADSNSEYARFQLGLSYLNAKEPDRAEKTLRESIRSGDFYSRKAQLVLAENFIKNTQYYQARTEIQDLLLFTKDTIETQRLNRLLGWIDLQENDLSRAENDFFLAKDSLIVKEVQSLKRLPYKNLNEASLLSTILPGSGEIYCGHYWTGISAFLINAASIVAIVYSVNKKNYVDATIVFSIFFSRVYLGSRQNAHDFAIEYNQKLYRQRIKEINKDYNLFPNQ